MLLFNLFADIILVAFFRPVHALLLSVLVLALFLAFLVVRLAGAHVL